MPSFRETYFSVEADRQDAGDEVFPAAVVGVKVEFFEVGLVAGVLGGRKAQVLNSVIPAIKNKTSDFMIMNLKMAVCQEKSYPIIIGNQTGFPALGMIYGAPDGTLLDNPLICYFKNQLWSSGRF